MLLVRGTVIPREGRYVPREGGKASTSQNQSGGTSKDGTSRSAAKNVSGLTVRKPKPNVLQLRLSVPDDLTRPVLDSTRDELPVGGLARQTGQVDSVPGNYRRGEVGVCCSQRG